MKHILLIARIFTGLVFIFSGFVKAVDPAGSAIKFEEYFEAFHLGFLSGLSFPLALVLSSAELMIGLNLVLRIRMKFTAWLLLIFMAYFTILTFILAFTNPVTDCGCFGDAIKLTNWQTFWKNIILLIPTLLIFFNRQKFKLLTTPFSDWYLTSVNFILPVLLSVFCIIHQPLLDFRPYKTGTNIPEQMIIPKDAPTDVYMTLLVYQKNGITQEFTEDTYPWQDTTWKWVETKQKLITRGYEPPIHNFSVTTLQGEDITEKVLTDSNYTLLIIAPKLENASSKGMKSMNELAMKADAIGLNVLGLTSSASGEIEVFIDSFKPSFEICTVDETTLKTIIRANPGLLILREGNILGKWNFRDAPEPDDLQNNFITVILQNQSNTIEILSVILLAIILALFYTGFHLSFKN